MSAVSVTALRLLRLAVGTAQVVAAEPVAGLALGRAPTDAEVLVTRILGGRHLGQGLTPTSVPGGSLLNGPLLDALHSASMLALAAAFPRHRRGAAVSAAVAGSFALLALRARK